MVKLKVRNAIISIAQIQHNIEEKCKLDQWMYDIFKSSPLLQDFPHLRDSISAITINLLS